MCPSVSHLGVALRQAQPVRVSQVVLRLRACHSAQLRPPTLTAERFQAPSGGHAPYRSPGHQAQSSCLLVGLRRNRSEQSLSASAMSNSALKQLHLEAKSRKGQGAGVPLALPKPQPQGGPRRHRSFTRKTPAQKVLARRP